MQIHLMIGVPGSGKSTAIQTTKEKNSIIISRDTVRKTILLENQCNEYFKYENLVFAEFVRAINDAIKSNEYEHIYIDATHISPSSRTKILSRLRTPENITLNLEVIKCSLSKCLERNAKRTGFERVPDSAINNMYNSFSIPAEEEILKWKNKFKVVILRIIDNEEELNDLSEQ